MVCVVDFFIIYLYIYFGVHLQLKEVSYAERSAILTFTLLAAALGMWMGAGSGSTL